MNLEAATTAAAALLREVDPGWGSCMDEELLAGGAAVEALGRLVDGLRIAFAAEVEGRSFRKGEGLRLPARFGLKDGTDLVAYTARLSRREAARRVNLGAELAARRSLTGEALPGRHPDLAAAVADGGVGLDSARVITDLLSSVRRRADASLLRTAEVSLTAAAHQQDAEAIRRLASEWAERLDDSGPRPREHQAHQQRTVRVGRMDEYGGSRFSGYLPPEERAILLATLAEARKQTAMTRTPAGHDDNDGPGPEWRETDGERRTVGQMDFDTLWGLLTAGIRASATETTSASAVKAIPEVIVTTTLHDLGSRSGSGRLTSTAAPVSIETVERLSCGADVRLQINGSAGEPLWLGRPTRLFSPAQRRSLIAASGGGCQWPGCTAPPVWCDVHHIAWFHRDDGPTDVDNGVLLCSFHHHLIHEPAGRWRMVVHDQRPHLVPRTWRGDPEPRHRMRGRGHPSAQPTREPDRWGRPLRT